MPEKADRADALKPRLVAHLRFGASACRNVFPSAKCSDERRTIHAVTLSGGRAMRSFSRAHFRMQKPIGYFAGELNTVLFRDSKHPSYRVAQFNLLMAITTAMAGSSRTLNQGGADGWLPKYLGYVNSHGAPTRGMWTDLAFNVILLSMSNYLFVLAVSNCNCLIFNFLNLNAGWVHRIDNPNVKRPWRCPTWLLALGGVLAYANAFLLGAGANVCGAGTLVSGFVSSCHHRPDLRLPALRRRQGRVPETNVRGFTVARRN